MVFEWLYDCILIFKRTFLNYLYPWWMCRHALNQSLVFIRKILVFYCNYTQWRNFQRLYHPQTHKFDVLLPYNVPDSLFHWNLIYRYIKIDVKLDSIFHWRQAFGCDIVHVKIKEELTPLITQNILHLFFKRHFILEMCKKKPIENLSIY